MTSFRFLSRLSRYSIYPTVVLIVAVSVTLSVATGSYLTYQSNKKILIDTLDNRVHETIFFLSNILSDYIESYSLNEYKKIIEHEMFYERYKAIIVYDGNAGSIFGKDYYITGKYRDKDNKLYDYDQIDSSILNYLEHDYKKYESDIKSKDDRYIGHIHIYVSDYDLNELLIGIIKERIVYTVITSIFIILFLFYSIRQVVLKPIKDITRQVSNADENGLPAHTISSRGLLEIKILADTLNLMIAEIQNSRQKYDKIQQQLLQAEKLSSVGKFSASIAHEFNNPLQGVMNVISGVLERNRLNDNDTRLANLALKECHRMKNLISNLKEFNRPTSGRRSQIDLHQCINEVLLLLGKELSGKNIDISRNYIGKHLEIWAVEDQLKQVLFNLIGNAGDAIGKNGKIDIETAATEGNVLISISDNGQGISPENIHSIFEPFYTTKSIKGNGLGLSVSYSIIKAHGGDIRVDSEPGQGATFTLTLPREMRQ